MALPNRTTGGNSRDEANRAQHLLSQQKPSPLPPNSPEQTSDPPEPDRMVLTWQTINRMNKLELENSLLKESLASLTKQMAALEEEQKRFFQTAEVTINLLNQCVNNFDGRIDSLSIANRQLQLSINAAMNRVSDEIILSVNDTLGRAQLDLARKSACYVSQLESVSKGAVSAFERTEQQIQSITQRNLWLTVTFYVALICNLIGCIQWIQTLF